MQLSHLSHLSRCLLRTRRAFTTAVDGGFGCIDGLHPHVVSSLHDKGVVKPTRIQKLGMRAISRHPPETKVSVGESKRNPSDVVIAAETGSGKTLTYLAPIASALLHGPSRKASALILCPNLILCEQVSRVAQSFFACQSDDSGMGLRVKIIKQGLLYPATVGTSEGISSNLNDTNDSDVQMPTIVVSTPAAFLNLVEGCDQGHQKHIVRTLRQIVFDEADILLTAYGTGLNTAASQNGNDSKIWLIALTVCLLHGVFFSSDIRRLWALLAFHSLHDQSMHGFMGYAKKDTGKFMRKLHYDHMAVI